MSYGLLLPAQQEALRPFVEGKIVHDLGAGTCELSQQLLNLGAKHIVAIDSQVAVRPSEPRIEVVRAYFDDLRLDPEVSFISWPANRPDAGLFRLVFYSKIAVYLGNNFDGSCCAWPGFFYGMLKREVLAYVPARKNSMIIYGGHLREERKPLPEEAAGIDDMEVRAYSEDLGSSQVGG